MPRCNRVTPEGEIIVASWRGTFMGNRGPLMSRRGELGRARWRQLFWITCRLEPRPGHAPRPLDAPNLYTPLFFVDEATACAAGHRPCAHCRHATFRGYQAAWAEAYGAQASAPEIDRALHAARVDAQGRQITQEGRAADLPFGAMFRTDQGLWLRSDHGIRPHDPRSGSYGPERPAGPETVEILTPAPSLAVMRAGWRPELRMPEV